jgi:uncharacterized membrane protein YhaH (DUF805 family)
MKPELKALLFVVVFMLATVLVAIVLPMIHPQALIWLALAIMVYALYSLAVGYFKFSDGVNSVNKKYEDNK